MPHPTKGRGQFQNKEVESTEGRTGTQPEGEAVYTLFFLLHKEFYHEREKLGLTVDLNWFKSMDKGRWDGTF